VASRIIGRMDNPAQPVHLSVLGSGYVGLVTATCLAGMGHIVRCVERDPARLASLSGGVVPFREPGLDEAFATALSSGRLTFSDEQAAIHGSDAVLVAVGTLDAAGDWTGDQVEAAVMAVALDELAPRTIIIRSTLLPGTTARLQRLASQIDSRVEIAVNPEFTRQGSAVRDFYAPDRIVVGTTRPVGESAAASLLGRVYGPLEARLVVTDAASAELIKVGANAFLGLKIGYANEIARIAAELGADVGTVVDAIGLDRRIGREFLSPGPGFGGSCLPSQSRALPGVAATYGVDAPILAAIEPSNRIQARWVVEQLERALGPLAGVPIAVLGLTFKAGTDDLRESSSLAIIRGLHERGAQIAVHDPLALSAGVAALARDRIEVHGATDVLVALAGARAVVVATEWPLYRSIDWIAARATMAGDIVFDVRQVVDVEAATMAGVALFVQGRRVAARRAAPTAADGA
jgi:UDPglucose 6-dehydrogenase